MKSRFVACLVIVALIAAAASAADKKPVKVFLLVGQSNMQGKGSAKHLEELVKSDPKKYGHLMKDGKWVKRDDVWIYFGSVKKKMERALKRIQNGSFAKEWIEENRTGQKNFKRIRKEEEQHDIEKVGARLRGLMPWIKKRKIKGASQASYS